MVFNFLGFFLKRNSYNFDDWYWLYNKIELLYPLGQSMAFRGGLACFFEVCTWKYLGALGNYHKNPERNSNQDKEKYILVLLDRKEVN